MCSANLTCLNGSRIRVVLRELLLRIKDWIIDIGSEKDYRLLFYVSPQRKDTPYGKTFYQIL